MEVGIVCHAGLYISSRSFISCVSRRYRVTNLASFSMNPFLKCVYSPCSLSRLYWNKLSILIILGLEKSVWQYNAVYPLHLWIIHKVAIQEEEHRHINLPSANIPNRKYLLSSSQFLFLETETLNFIKIRRNLSWIHLPSELHNPIEYIISGNSNDIILWFILSFIER